MQEVNLKQHLLIYAPCKIQRDVPVIVSQRFFAREVQPSAGQATLVGAYIQYAGNVIRWRILAEMHELSMHGGYLRQHRTAEIAFLNDNLPGPTRPHKRDPLDDSLDQSLLAKQSQRVPDCHSRKVELAA